MKRIGKKFTYADTSDSLITVQKVAMCINNINYGYMSKPTNPLKPNGEMEFKLRTLDILGVNNYNNNVNTHVILNFVHSYLPPFDKMCIYAEIEELLLTKIMELGHKCYLNRFFIKKNGKYIINVGGLIYTQ